MTKPTVTLILPVLDEERHISACLDAVAAQTYTAVVEVLVVDGGSTDRTRELASARERVRVLDNPRRIQAAALNIGLAHARGRIIVRVDGHCVISPDYVERCVAALEQTGAALVGGGMHPVAGDSWMEQGIAAAMRSRLGAGPARFHAGERAGWVDTVYLGAYWADTARRAGGHREDVGVNEDAEFAVRMGRLGGVWLDPAIRSTYTPRGDLTRLSRQFRRYGRSRAATLRLHPRSARLRQLAPPLLVAGLMSPWRRQIGAAYVSIVVGRAVLEMRRSPGAAAGFALAAPVMHGAWAAGFISGSARAWTRPRPPEPGPLAPPAPHRARAA